MSNKSGNLTSFVCIRSTGSKDQAGNLFGGVYYPAHTKNGRSVSGRWEGNFAINGADYTDAQGQRQEGSSDYVRLVVWNSKNAASGKGLADVFAKCVSPGKEISCVCKIHTFQKRLFINGQPIADTQGQPITYPAVSFRVNDDVIFGADSNRSVAGEIAAFSGQMNFQSRPQYWNVVGHADNEAWKQIVAWRMAQIWDGQSGSYGYARVIVPEGAQVTMPGAQPSTVGLSQGQPQPGMAPTVAAPLTQPAVATVAPIAQPAVAQPTVQVQTTAPLAQPATQMPI